MIFNSIKVSPQFNAEITTANVKMPVVRLVSFPMLIRNALPLIPVNINIMLRISSITMIETTPDHNPFKSGGLSSMCADTQMQMYRNSQNCQCRKFSALNSVDIMLIVDVLACLKKIPTLSIVVKITALLFSAARIC